MTEQATAEVISAREARRAQAREKAAVTPLPISFVASGVEVGRDFAAMVLPLKGHVKELFFCVGGENLRRVTVEVTLRGTQTVVTTLEGGADNPKKILDSQAIEAYSVLTAKVTATTPITAGQPVTLVYAWIAGYMEVAKSYLTEIVPTEVTGAGILTGA